MFESLKKSKTLRSLLGAASLFTAGMATQVEAAPKAPQKMTQSASSACSLLAKDYRPVCEQLEGNYPYCYYGKTGNVTVGCGVHVKDFSDVQKLPALRITPKKGKRFVLGDHQRLFRMANADWQDPATYTSFPEVEKAEKIRVENCEGDCPKSTDKVWGRTLLLMPARTLEKINDEAVQFHVRNAYENHPNLFSLPPAVQFVVVDLIYNLGYEKYKKDFPNFQEAIRKGDLWEARKECSVRNSPRRTEAHKILMDVALLCEARCAQKSPQKTFEELKKLVGRRKNTRIKPSNEAAFWKAVEVCTAENHSWFLVRDKRVFSKMAQRR